MKNMIGFGSRNKPEKVLIKQEEATVCAPIRSVVQVRFLEDDRTLPYYNDLFELKTGDVVFVSGKMAGKMGVVSTVTTKFKVNLSHYQKVIARPEFTLSGTFTPFCGMMVSTYECVKPDAEMFRSWVKPPIPDRQEDEIVYGEGYRFSLDDFENDADVDERVFSRALEYLEAGKVRFLSLKDGVGTAFVEGTVWYEINFRYDNGNITDLYCECPYPGLCKHNIAVLLLLRLLLNQIEMNNKPEFVAIESRFFWNVLSTTKQQITV